MGRGCIRGGDNVWGGETVGEEKLLLYTYPEDVVEEKKRQQDTSVLNAEREG